MSHLISNVAQIAFTITQINSMGIPKSNETHNFDSINPRESFYRLDFLKLFLNFIVIDN